MTLDPVRTDPRRGGAVQRYHTWPTLQRQQVSDHSWNVLRILVTIWPDAPREAILYAQFHDVGEVGTGDPPYPVKADNPVLKSEMDRLEGASVSEMGLMHHLTLDDHWRNRVKICDVLEMWEFGADEVALGNVFATRIVDRMVALLRELENRFRLDNDEITCIRRYERWRASKQP